jgi:hypothetical protein
MLFQYDVNYLSMHKADLKNSRGCEPLTPDDIAEVIVFAATRGQNVVIADTLIFPSHQVGISRRVLLQSTPLEVLSDLFQHANRLMTGRCYHHA